MAQVQYSLQYSPQTAFASIRPTLSPARLYHCRAGGYESFFWKTACPTIKALDWKVNGFRPEIWPGITYTDLEPAFGDLREICRTTPKGIQVLGEKDIMKMSPLFCEIYGIVDRDSVEVILQTNRPSGVIQRTATQSTDFLYNYQNFEEPLKGLKVGLSLEDVAFALGLPNDQFPDKNQLKTDDIILNNYTLCQGQPVPVKEFNWPAP